MILAMYKRRVACRKILYPLLLFPVTEDRLLVPPYQSPQSNASDVDEVLEVEQGITNALKIKKIDTISILSKAV